MEMINWTQLADNLVMGLVCGWGISLFDQWRLPILILIPYFCHNLVCKHFPLNNYPEFWLRFIAETPRNVNTAAHVKQRLGSMSAHANLQSETFHGKPL